MKIFLSRGGDISGGIKMKYRQRSGTPFSTNTRRLYLYLLTSAARTFNR